MSDADRFEANPPAQFRALSLSDQRSKLKRRREIETNWECDVRYCVPSDIRPRSDHPGQSQHPGSENGGFKRWWRWSVEFMTKLSKISHMTAGNLNFAQELMVLEVKDRQRGGKDMLSSRRELSLKDINRVMDALLQAYKPGPQTFNANDSDNDATSDGTDVGEEDEEGDGENRENVRDEGDQGEEVEIDRGETEDSSDGASMSVKREVPDEHHPSSAPLKRQKLRKPDNIPAKIAAFRGKAMRREQQAAKLQAEAAKWKAEAYELESKWILQSVEGDSTRGR